MAKLTSTRYGRRVTHKVVAQDEHEGNPDAPRGTFTHSYRCGDKVPPTIVLQFRVSVDGGHVCHEAELSGAEFLKIVRAVATSSLMVDHESALDLSHDMRRIFNQH